MGGVPHFLMRDQMQERVRLGEDNINRHEKEGETYLNRIVAIDDTWLHSYEPELKSQSTNGILQPRRGLKVS